MSNVLKVQFEQSYLINENIKKLMTTYEAELKVNNFKKIIEKELPKFSSGLTHVVIEFMSEENIPWPFTSILEFTFYGCSNLTSIIIPDSVISIGEEAFAGCKSLKEVVIPDSVTHIDEWAFKYCDRLTIKTKNPYVIEYCKQNHISYKEI